MTKLQINQIVQRIEEEFGDDVPFSGRPLTPDDVDALERVFGDAGYQGYQDDQTNRHIIRVYLTNAVVLGYLPENGIGGFSRHVKSPESRATLALLILMSSLEDVEELLSMGEEEALNRLSPEPGDAPHLTLVGN